MEFIIKTNDEVAGLDIVEALSLAGIQHTILSKQRDTQARLTATENALVVAGVLLRMSTAENNYLSAFSTCDICNAPTWSGHEETCEYRIVKERYQAACEVLEKVTK